MAGSKEGEIMSRKCNECLYFNGSIYQEEYGEVRAMHVSCSKKHFEALDGFETENFIDKFVKAVDTAKNCLDFYAFKKNEEGCEDFREIRESKCSSCHVDLKGRLDVYCRWDNEKFDFLCGDCYKKRFEGQHYE